MTGKPGVSRRHLGFSGRHGDKNLGSQAEVFRFYPASTSDDAHEVRSQKPDENAVLKSIFVEKQSKEEKRD